MTAFKPNTCQTCALLHNSIRPCSRCVYSVFKTSDTGRTDLWQPVDWFLEIQQLKKELDAEKDVNAMRKRRAGTCQVCGTERDLTISWTFDAWICDSCMDKQMENYVLYRNLKEQLKTAKEENDKLKNQENKAFRINLSLRVDWDLIEPIIHDDGNIKIVQAIDRLRSYFGHPRPKVRPQNNDSNDIIEMKKE